MGSSTTIVERKSTLQQHSSRRVNSSTAALTSSQTSKSSLAILKQRQSHTNSIRVVRCPQLDSAGSAQMHLPEYVLKLAKEIYSEVTSRKIYRSDNVMGMQAVSLYYACLASKATRSIAEICKAFDLSESVFTRCDKNFREIYRDNKSAFFNFRDLFDATQATDLLVRGINKITELDDDQSRKVRKLSFQMLEAIRSKKALVGKSSGAIASAVIFISIEKVGLKLSKKNVCTSLNLVTTVTLNSMLKDLRSNGLYS